MKGQESKDKVEGGDKTRGIGSENVGMEQTDICRMKEGGVGEVGEREGREGREG